MRRRLSEFFRDRGRDDLLLLHVSCHGLKDEDGTLYFASSNTAVDHLEATAIPSEFVNRQMTKSRSRRIVLLLDCCFGGAFARGLVHRAGESVAIKEEFEGQGRVVLTASRAMEYAFEGENLEGDAQPSIFTSAVVHGLESGEADRDRDSRVSIDELYDYVYDRVRETTPNQTPSKWTFDVHGDLYVARSPFTAPEPEPVQLPVELTAAMESPFAAVRTGAVSELGRLAHGSDESLSVVARAALADLAVDDSRRVSEAAERALAAEPGPELVEGPPERVAEAQAEADAARSPASRIGRALARGARWQDGLAIAAAVLIALGYFQHAYYESPYSFAVGFEVYIWYIWPPVDAAAVVALAAGATIARRSGRITHAAADGLLLGAGTIALLGMVGFLDAYGFGSALVLTTAGALALTAAAAGGLVTRRGRETAVSRRTLGVATAGAVLLFAPLAIDLANFNSSLLDDWWGRSVVFVPLGGALAGLVGLLVLIGAPRERHRAAGALVATGLLLALHLGAVMLQLALDEKFGALRFGGPLGILGALLLVGAGAQALRSTGPAAAPAAAGIPAT